MPRYYTDFEIDGLNHPDTEGEVFATQALAEADVRQSILVQARRLLSFDEPSKFSVRLRDGDAVVFSITAQWVCQLS